MFEKAASVLNGERRDSDDVEKRGVKRPSIRESGRDSNPRESYQAKQEKERKNREKIPDFYKADEHREIFNRDSNRERTSRDRTSRSKSKER